MAKMPDYFYFRVKAGSTKVKIEDASDADVVEVVRCSRCIHAEQAGDEPGSEFLCHFYGDQWNGADHFCSHGERRTDGSNL